MTPSTSSASAPTPSTRSAATNGNAHERSHTPTGRWVKHTRWALLKAPDRQSLQQLGTLGEVYQRNRRPYRAFLLYHQLRLL